MTLSSNVTILSYEYDLGDHLYYSISREESPTRGAPSGLARSNTLSAKTASPQIRRKQSRSMKIAPPPGNAATASPNTEKSAGVAQGAAGGGSSNDTAPRVKKESTVVLPTGPVDVSALMGKTLNVILIVLFYCLFSFFVYFVNLENQGTPDHKIVKQL